MTEPQRRYVKDGVLVPLEEQYLDTTEWGLVRYADARAWVEAAVAEAEGKRLVMSIFHSPNDGPRAFALVRTHDVSGVSGTGTVAYGVEFPDGTVALRWTGSNPTSVVFHDNGMESVEAVHGHGGHTKIAWLSEDLGERAAEMDECEWRGYVRGHRDMLARCIAAVESLPLLPYQGEWAVSYPKAIAALRALGGSDE